MQSTGQLTRIAALGCTALIVGLAACGGSGTTGPSGGNPTAAQSAAHFDSIYAAYLAAGTAADSARAAIVAIFVEITPAYGGTQQNFTVTTAGGTATWYGFTYQIVESNGDSAYFTVAYDGLSLNNLIVFEQDDPTGGPRELSAALVRLASDSVYDDSVATGSATTASLGASCGQQSGLAADSLLAAYIGSGTTCRSGTFLVSASAGFYGAANLGPLTSWVIDDVPFSGVRFDITGEKEQRPVIGPPTRLAATLEQLRAAHVLPRGSRWTH